MEHKITLIILDGDIIIYEGEFENHKLAVSEAIKKLFELNCKSTISNIGEYTIDNYQHKDEYSDVKNLDLTNLPVKDTVPYCHGRFRCHRVFPDLMNNFSSMCESVMQNKYQFKFLIKPVEN
ncbi:hypothetical protein ma41 [Moumouvirus australiensis]|uniref:Uncharacterized protein n=1 Tax=Moumouvirus australiensis TaxID=2109587 RepID=A0A2P1EKM3_9VIRU|nr:hypothetical protein QKC55_gp862 [Moumouvirus australiensis]AVL94428.1 hypothetical protein ma41 [Moumouvirus australiensis]